MSCVLVFSCQPTYFLFFTEQVLTNCFHSNGPAMPASIDIKVVRNSGGAQLLHTLITDQGTNQMLTTTLQVCTLIHAAPCVGILLRLIGGPRKNKKAEIWNVWRKTDAPILVLILRLIKTQNWFGIMYHYYVLCSYSEISCIRLLVSVKMRL